MNLSSLFNPKWCTGNHELQAVAYYYKTFKSYQMPVRHQHKFIEIMYVLKGKCLVELEHELIQLQKGEFIVLDAEVSHRLIVEEGISCQMLNIEFVFRVEKESVLSFEKMIAADTDIQEMIQTPFQFVVLKDREEIYHTLKQLIQTSDQLSQNKLLYAQTLYFHLLRGIAILWKQQDEELMSTTKSHVKRAAEYIQKHYDHELKVHDIAESLNVHENYLQRIFKHHMEMTIVDYIILHRMERAQKLLLNTDLSVIEICELCGINSRQYFSKLFKKHYGLSPQVYRKNNELLKLSYTPTSE